MIATITAGHLTLAIGYATNRSAGEAQMEWDRMLALAILLTASAVVLAACDDSTSPVAGGNGGGGGGGGGGSGGGAPGIAVEVVASGLSSPLYLTSPPGDDRLFVVEQPGRVRIVKGGQLLERPFLDLTGQLSSGGERGLLSIAFHPDYAANGFFYVDYTDTNGDTRVERYSVSSDPDVADAGSAKLILGVDQPFGNHNGGLVAFGLDGMLYVGLGDGGSGGDPQGNGQNTSTLLGSVLRLDVDGGDPYAIPPGNPFAGTAGADEIWAYGLRNPWRFSFDATDGLLYIGDVGQNEWEEVDVESASAAGVNYGWNIMEGLHCYPPDEASCDQTDLELPVLEYGHTGGACSVTGGYVYRGSAMPDLQGLYFYSDFCAGFLKSFRYSGGSVSDEREWDVGDIGSVLSFGVDDAGELYILSGDGNVYRLVEAS